MPSPTGKAIEPDSKPIVASVVASIVASVVAPAMTAAATVARGPVRFTLASLTQEYNWLGLV